MLDALLDLLFPPKCCACDGLMDNQSYFLCNTCFQGLPRINCLKRETNPVEIKFWGRVPFESAVSLFYFNSGGAVQHIFHQLKYKNQKKLGIKLGELAAIEFEPYHFFEKIDVIIPIPLHTKKLRKRGYNQSELIAQGIAQKTGINIRTDILQKVVHTSSQTKKDRMERWDNVATSFSIDCTELRNYCHILLVDDVLTTGATAEAAANCMLKIKNIRISFLSIALTY